MQSQEMERTDYASGSDSGGMLSKSLVFNLCWMRRLFCLKACSARSSLLSDTLSFMRLRTTLHAALPFRKESTLLTLRHVLRGVHRRRRLQYLAKLPVDPLPRDRRRTLRAAAVRHLFHFW